MEVHEIWSDMTELWNPIDKTCSIVLLEVEDVAG